LQSSNRHGGTRLPIPPGPQQSTGTSPRKNTRALLSDKGNAFWVVVHDGMEYGPYESCPESLVLSADGSRVAFKVSIQSASPPYDRRMMVVVDGKSSPLYEEIGELVFSPDSQHLAFWARKHGKELAVLDGVDGPPEEHVYPVVFFSPDSKHLWYRAFQRRCHDLKRHDGLAYPLPDWLEPQGSSAVVLGFSEDSQHVVALLPHAIWIDGTSTVETVTGPADVLGFEILYESRPFSRLPSTNGDDVCLLARKRASGPQGWELFKAIFTVGSPEQQGGAS
jgi:hypothetical protein